MGILVKNISKKFGEFKAVDDVTFQVQEGELVALLGPSGSGKSTILRIIAGLETPDRGEIYLTGQDVTGLSTQKRKVGFVFQHYALFKHMTVEKNISFGMEIQKKSKEFIQEKVLELINLVKLHGYEKHYPDQLSGGQRQRVALARALATEPRVLLLDEPFGSLDAKVRSNLAQWLRDFHDTCNITSVFVTHDQSEAIEIADKIVLINRGRVEQFGNAREVYEYPKSKFVASFIGQVNVLDAMIEKNGIHINGTDTLIDYPGKTTSISEAVLLVRPEDIEIVEDSTNQSLRSKIKTIHYRGSFYEIDCDIGSTMVSLIIGKTEYNRFPRHEGDRVPLNIKAFKVFSAEEGHAKLREKLRDLGYIE